MILLVDDEKRWAENYREELEEGLPQHEIQFRDRVDDALEILRGGASRVKLLILDIMMPPGNAFKNVDTRSGLRTGRRFFELVRQEEPELPVIILTNVSDVDEEQFYEGQARCWFFRKEDCSPIELTERVKDILNRAAA